MFLVTRNRIKKMSKSRQIFVVFSHANKFVPDKFLKQFPLEDKFVTDQFLKQF